MFIPMPTWLRVPLATTVIVASTVLHVTPLFVAAAIKAIVRLRAIRSICDRTLIAIAESWIAVNSGLIRTFTRTRIEMDISAQLRRDGHYLVLANHQSWVDIPMLQAVFNRRIPFMRFFLKSQLFWVPLLGLAWWALDFPFMKRYSKKDLAKRPELARRDIEATRRACEKFRHIPVSLMNFVEGTRFTAAKHRQQNSPYPHLLKPKAGGVAFVMNALGDALHAILDVTIVYPNGKSTLADLFADRIRTVKVHVRELALPADLINSNYERDPAARERMQAWINGLWAEKEQRMVER